MSLARFVTILAVFLSLIGVSAADAGAATISGTVSGQQVGQEPDPLSDASVSVFDSSTSKEVSSTSTAANGTYSVEVPSGTYDVRFAPTSGGFEPTTVHSVEVAGSRVLNVILTPGGTVHLTGTLRDAGGHPVPGAQLLLNTGHTPTVSATTAADGSYSFAAVPDNYELVAYSGKAEAGVEVPSSWFFETAFFALEADQVRNLQLPPIAQVTVEALGKGDTPIAEATVQVPNFSGSADLGGLEGRYVQARNLNTSTNAEGRATFTVFTGSSPMGTPSISPPAASGYGYTPFEIPQVNADTTVAVHFDSGEEAPPAITGLSPARGTEVGGTEVQISGSGFSDATEVRFGSLPAAEFSATSPTSITAVSPPGTGTVGVTVTTPSGTSEVVAAGRFAYQPEVTIASTPNPSVHGAKVTFTAKVAPLAPGAPTPLGTVAFVEGSTTLGVVNLKKGAATLSTTAIGAGEHPVVASYSGDSYYGGAESSAVVQTVEKATTQLTLSSSLNPAPYGATGTIKATVKAVAPGTGTPAGTVTFLEGETALATVQLSGASAALPLKTLPPGSHAITAAYSGDPNDFPTEGGTLTQTIVKASTETTLVSTLEPAPYGSTATLKATVKALAPATGTPPGTVTFREGETVLAIVPLSGSIAKYALKSLPPGNHEVTATYSGDSNYEASGSAIVQAIAKATTALNLTSSKNPAPHGSSATLKATVKALAPATGTPPGTVTFREGETVLAILPLSGGAASFPLKSLASGTHSITASYSGDANYEPAEGTISQVISP